MRIGYVIVGVGDFERSIAFFRDTMGFPPIHADTQFQFAAFQVGDLQFSIAGGGGGGDAGHGTGGRNTGIGFMVEDVDAVHAELVGKGVHFTMEPAQQPWGGYMAMFTDPDGNIYYLDQAR
jgi:lactoylglutathione lyase